MQLPTLPAQLCFSARPNTSPPPCKTPPCNRQGLLAELLFHKPVDPRKFVIDQLERAKAAGGRPLLAASDLASMYDLFDVTKAGAVTAAQAAAALATALGGARAAEAIEAAAHGGGPAAAAAGNPLAGRDLGARRLDKQEFVKCVGEVLIRATPNCQLASLRDDGEADEEEEDGGSGAAAAHG
jgi:hypothetical protein